MKKNIKSEVINFYVPKSAQQEAISILSGYGSNVAWSMEQSWRKAHFFLTVNNRVSRKVLEELTSLFKWNWTV